MFKYFTNGIIKNNPVLVMLIGLCSVCAISTNVYNALVMASAVLFVLTISNIVISVIRKAIPEAIRILVFIVVISTLATLIDYGLHAFLPNIHSQLGVFVPLIAANCIILSRAEVFASKQGILASALDGLGQGIGYTFVIFLMAGIREILGSGKIFGYTILGQEFAKSPVLFMMLPPGGFLVLAFLMGMMNWLSNPVRNSFLNGTKSK